MDTAYARTSPRHPKRYSTTILGTYYPFFLQGSAKILMKQNLMTPKEKSAPTFEKNPTPPVSNQQLFKEKTFKNSPLLKISHLFWSRIFCLKKLAKKKLDASIFFGMWTMWTLQPWNRSYGARPLHLPTPSPPAHAAVVPCWSCASDAASAHALLDGRTAWRTGGFFELTSLSIWDEWDMLDLPPIQDFQWQIKVYKDSLLKV